MNARDTMLARISEALADRPSPGPVVRSYVLAGARTSEAAATVELFAERVADYRATVRRCAEADVPAAITAALSASAVRRIVVPPGFPKQWYDGGIGDDPPLGHAALDAVDGVVTTCALGIAETGTVVLDHSAGQGRRALTLVPDYHLVVIRAAQIVPAVPDAIAALTPTLPLTWVSGPSATSDIELARVEGVHGPRRLEVLIAG